MKLHTHTYIKQINLNKSTIFSTLLINIMFLEDKTYEEEEAELI